MNVTTYNDLQFDELLDAQEQKARYDAAQLRSAVGDILFNAFVAVASEFAGRMLQRLDVVQRAQVKRVVFAGESVDRGDLVKERG